MFSSGSRSRLGAHKLRSPASPAKLIPLSRSPDTRGTTVTATRHDLSDLPEGLLATVYDYWSSKFTNGQLPARRDIDPLEFPQALGRICLLEVTHEPLSFRYRVDGSLISEHRGYDLTGKTTDEVRPLALANLLRAEYGHVARTTYANYFEITCGRDTVSAGYRILALPLSSDGEQVDMILDCAVGTEVLQTLI